MSSMIVLFCFVTLASCLPIQQDIASAVQSERILVENPFAVHDNKVPDVQEREHQIPAAAGGALDLFYRYGFFSLSVRVVPRKDPGSWVIREPTASIFDEKSVDKQQEISSQVFSDNYQIFLCDDVSELMDAYFNDFKADGVPQPHKLFSGSWQKKTLGKYMGLSPKMFNGDYSFVLAKMVKSNRVVKVEGNPKLHEEAQKSANSIEEGNTESVMDFIHNYGSHYIKEISMGEVVYQVFALDQDQYTVARKALSGVSNLDTDEFSQIYEEALAPWMITETGIIKAASGKEELQKFLDEEPRIAGQFGTYPNIFQFQKDANLMNKLETLSTSDAITGLHFSSLESTIPSGEQRDFYDQVVATQISLWDVNII